MRKASFAPVVAPGCRILILGSLPGEKSLAAGRYYANPQNRFWHLVGHATGVDFVSRDYEMRLQSLKALRIGLWDVIADAKREGSLDSAIREARTNPLRDLAATLPDLKAVAFNGRKAEIAGRAVFDGLPLTLLGLPSSSPAYAAMPLAEKETRWKALRDFLETPRG